MTSDRVNSVSQPLNDRCSAIAHAWAQTTFSGSPSSLQESAGFLHTVVTSSGPVSITSDGIGTKVEIAERMARYETLGFDLVAMVVDDLVAGGSRPAALSNILDVDRFDEAVIDELMRGLATAARVAGIVIAGGEIAQLGDRIGGYGDHIHFNWCATAIGVPLGRDAAADRPPRSGDLVIALASDGFRSNGFTLARSILGAGLGADWHRALTGSGEAWGACLLTPSRIYSPTIVGMLAAGLPVVAGVHVTGGGIPGNLPRVVDGGRLRMDLTNLWPPHPAMCELVQMADIDPQHAYEQWNMGTGFLCVVPPEAADATVSFAEGAGIRACIAGGLAAGRGVRIDARAWNMGELTFGDQR